MFTENGWEKDQDRKWLQCYHKQEMCIWLFSSKVAFKLHNKSVNKLAFIWEVYSAAATYWNCLLDWHNTKWCFGCMLQQLACHMIVAAHMPEQFAGY